MKILRIALLGLLFCSPLSTQAAVAVPSEDYDFQQDRMQLTPDSVMAISTFNNEDHITAYTYSGVQLWDAPFHAKIISWKFAGDFVFVFSKDRKGTKTYITCLDRHTGNLVWQKP
jgi:hypothetical protein